MRLICPNCGAQYAVADDVIPAAGRDVQCSNCAHTWFETPGASSKDEVPQRTPRPQPAPSAGPEEDKVAPAPRAPGNRRTVDPDVADILRQEAQRETAKRRAETPGPVETQDDLGLNEPVQERSKPDPAPAVRNAAATAAAATGAVAAAPPEQRRPKLPEIDDIDSGLDQDAETAQKQVNGARDDVAARKSFRRGFFVILVIIAILAALYVQAPRIKTAVPALGPTLDSYVATVDRGRVWLDETVRGALLSISSDS